MRRLRALLHPHHSQLTHKHSTRCSILLTSETKKPCPGKCLGQDYSNVRRGLPRSDDWTIHTQIAAIKQCRGRLRGQMTRKRSDQQPSSSLCPVTANPAHPRFETSKSRGSALPPPTIFFSMSASVEKPRIAAPYPRCQAIEIFVELTHGGRSCTRCLWR